METIIGIACKDHVIVAASAQANHSIIQIKDTEDKLHAVDSNKILATAGEAGDRVQFTDYVSRNLVLNATRQGRSNTAASAAHFIRWQLANSIRSRSPYQVFCLLAAYDNPLPELKRLNETKGENKPDGSGAYLWYMDYLGTMQQVPFATHGYGGTFCMAILDRYYKEDMTEDESKALMQKCIDEVKKRIVINNSKFCVKIINKDGIKVLPQME
jgi:20S proteasome subunit beta 4|uniref:Proteasome subunit beta n=1 Tax=Eutreptiella gymnastica TaxID=73025 RepID=A0A7S4CWQ4_9EUGL|mmetsp:Transcript_73022/g.123054  ORF Transcript_73022/g.123054 Transcript_73022/m.123054 type:complete len:214 (+) Transcript_73022:52-693(+)